MGGEQWFNYVAYQEDIGKAFRELLEAEFAAGNYTISDTRRPRSISELLKLAGSDGTGSILDFQGVVSTPREKPIDAYDDLEARPYFLKVVPLCVEDLMRYFGSKTPTFEQIESSYDFFDDVDRGHGIYVIFYERDKPVGIFFAGRAVD